MLSSVGLLATVALAQQPVDLTVERVAIFSSGVAYFEAGAEVDGRATAELTFRTEQINDILKSMIVQDLGGGTIGAVSYPTRDPIEKTLRSFGVDITGAPTLPDLLKQLRGEPVRISGGRDLEGLVFGVETRDVALGDNRWGREHIVNVLTDAGIQQVPLAQLSQLEFTNEKVATELREALKTLAMAHDANKKSVVLAFDGAGKRRVKVAYLLEAPLWKTSYRLALAKDEDPFLQGWANVENTTEEDWNNVRLSLVSGRPISFKMDLYSPLYVERPVEELELYAALRPPEYAAGQATEKLAAPQAAARTRGAGRAGGGRGRNESAVYEMRGRALTQTDNTLWFNADAALDLEESGVRAAATGEEAGELFQYNIDTPVTIARQRSAMIPIVNQKVGIDKVSIYNPATHPLHPLNGLEFHNETGLSLRQGPVTVFDDDVYAGDAKLPDMQPGEKRLVAYALDLAMRVVPRRENDSGEVTAVRVVRGAVIESRRVVDARTYVVTNNSDRERTLIIEQAYGDEWKLVTPNAPDERAPGLSRFHVKVPAGETLEFPVKLEQELEYTYALNAMNRDRILYFARLNASSDQLEEALREVIRRQDEIAKITARIERLQADQSEARREQERVRDNLRVLDRNTDVYQRQMRKFDEFETAIEELEAQIDPLELEREQTQQALNAYLASLNVR